MKNVEIHDAFQVALQELGSKFNLHAIVIIAETSPLPDGALVIETGGVNITVDDARRLAMEGALIMASTKVARVVKRGRPD